MTITVNTNMSSLLVQKSLNSATTKMETAMERMSTGLRINSSKDDAAGMAVSTKLKYKVSSLAVAQDNGQMGVSLLDTTEGSLNIIQANLQRIRDLTEQAANGTYGSDAMTAIRIEVKARLDEITRISNSTEFNGINLLDGSRKTEINLQVGIENDKDSIIKLDKKLFASTTTTTLIVGSSGFKVKNNGGTETTISAINDTSMKKIYEDDSTARGFLTQIDKALVEITDKKTEIGGSQQRIASAIQTAGVMETNFTSAQALIADADIAKESSDYIKQQILQQTSATLLASANQAPSIAMNLV